MKNLILNRCLVLLSLEEEAQEGSLEPGATGSAEPDHGRTCSGHGAEATSRPNAILTGTVFGPQLPVGSVGASHLSADKPEAENTRGLELRCASRLQAALCHYATQFSFPCAPRYKTVVTFRAA